MHAVSEKTEVPYRNLVDRLKLCWYSWLILLGIRPPEEERRMYLERGKQIAGYYGGNIFERAYHRRNYAGAGSKRRLHGYDYRYIR